MAEPPGGPSIGRFELMVSEFLARQTDWASGPPGADAPASPAAPPSPGTSAPMRPDIRSLPTAARPGLPDAPRPADYGLPGAERSAVPQGVLPLPLPARAAPIAPQASTPMPPVPDPRETDEPSGVAETADAAVPTPARGRLILAIGRTAAGPDAPDPKSPRGPRDAEANAPSPAPGAPAPDRSEANSAERLPPRPTESAGPEPETSISSGRPATEASTPLRPAPDRLPRLEPAGLALELALLVNAEMHKGWPTSRFVPLLERRRPHAQPLELDDDDRTEDEDSADDEGEERSSGLDALSAYVDEHAASRRLKRTLLFALGCYCALLNTLGTEILEYFAGQVDEEIERNHDRA